MAEFSGNQSAPDQTEPLPGWVIDHMIRLSEYAASSGLVAFEGKLIDATETLLQELNDAATLPAKVAADIPNDGSNVIPFVAAASSDKSDTKARCGTGCI